MRPYRFKWAYEIGFGGLIAAATFVLQAYLAADFGTITDVRAWAISLAAGAGRVGIAFVANALLTRPRSEEQPTRSEEEV